MKRIKINLKDRSYEVHIESGILDRIPFGTQQIKGKNYLILSVKKVFKRYGMTLVNKFKKAGTNAKFILIPDGEKYKNERTLFVILKKMAALGVQRDSCLITLGGGVVGDVGGFCAAIYMRGIQLIHCPTTLLAQVDASIGGKTAIDFWGVKNLLGSFYQPRLVLIDPIVLKTLSDRQYKTGLAEVVKYGVIQDEAMFKKMENNIPLILRRDEELLSFLIEKSCKIKARIVSEDEREKGKRAWLNYGHTLGHALESYFHYQALTHGEAIAHGMIFAAKLSFEMGLCNQSVLERQETLLRKIGLLRKLPWFNPKKILEKMFLDKKARDGKIQFILTRKIGLVTIQKNIPRSAILSALIQFQNSATR